jgi:ribonuclease HI
MAERGRAAAGAMRHRRTIRLADAADAEPAPLAEVEIWTDGACKGNPGPGGWGAWLKSGSHEKELFGGAPETTNNRMELTAVIEALASLKKRCRVVLHTDSQYVQLGIQEWMKSWVRRGWKTADNKPVKNADLWRRLAELAARHDVHWRWVRGHSGVAGNERADELANRGVELALRQRAAPR